MQLRIAGAQIPVVQDVSENVQTILRAIDFAAADGARILLTPEGSLSGYTHEIDHAATQAGLDQVLEHARDRRVGLALGTCFIEPHNGRCYNQLRFYDRSGAFLGFHAKILRCGTMTDPLRGEINHYATVPLRTFSFEGTTAGGLICNDLWGNPDCTPMPDPHLTQQLARLGAKVIFHAVNGGRDDSDFSRVTVFHFHQSNLQMRAHAGGLWIVTVDNASPLDKPCSAPCGVVAPDGSWAVRTSPVGEQFFAWTIDV